MSTTTTTIKPPLARGFDACAAPSLSSMTAWMSKSPYVGVGIYIGGSNRGCSQPNLTSAWVSNVIAQGWHTVPIWVGPQAPCSALSSSKLTSDSFGALVERWRRTFEFVIFDTAPMKHYADALAVSSHVGRVLALSRAEFTPANELRDMLRRLAVTRAHILGAVINRF